MSQTAELERDEDAIAASQIQLATFEVGKVTMAIDISRVQEINRLMDVTPVPGASPMIHGVVNLRGDVVTVVNPHRILDVQESGNSRSGRNLILNIDGERIGVLVDKVADILTVQRDQLSSPPSNVRSIDRRFIDSVYLQSNEVIIVLDPIGLLDSID